MMMEKLLAEIRKGGTLTPAILAKRLDTRVELVQMMLERLAEMGMIDDFSGNCAQPCSSCALAETCHFPARKKPRLWKLS